MEAVWAETFFDGGFISVVCGVCVLGALTLVVMPLLEHVVVTIGGMGVGDSGVEVACAVVADAIGEVALVLRLVLIVWVLFELLLVVVDAMVEELVCALRGAVGVGVLIVVVFK